LPHQHDAVDEANRLAFEECFRIIKKAWTEDALSYEGRFWRVPPGPTPWTLAATRDWGLGVENGVIKAVGVVPKPLQKPHPPLFQPFASSERSIRWCAQEGVTAILPPLHPIRERALFELYAKESGRPIGQGVGVLRDVIIADSDAEAQALWRDSSTFVGQTWFEPFGFSQGYPHPTTGAMPDFLGESLALVGAADTVTRQLERLLARLPLSWLFAWQYIQLIPHATLMRSIEQLWTKVLPRVSDVRA
jgi:alkanesulfonate monooxygenase SsuD/methylene tetrahydromethanopterin reductase-like flavin-dependent oxidoreductase (luciferase family)